jgi:uncharacterized RDD family membrane protein YckC
MDPISDQLSIDTPELVSIDLPLAGIGSRFIALLVDYLIWAAGLLVLGLLVWLFQPAVKTFSKLSYQWTIALLTFVLFVLNWGYFTLFEAFSGGKTPGKRVANIRVIQQSGRAIGLFESMARNLVRYIDQFPFCYAVGAITMFSTRQHQRLGDMAAGTLVVRDRQPDITTWADSGSRTLTANAFAPAHFQAEPHTFVSLPPSGIARLSVADLEVLEGFLSRRLDMTLATRRGLASRIESAIQAKSGLERPPGISDETFLEAVARDLRDLVRLK